MRDLPSPPVALATKEDPTAFYIAGTILNDKKPEHQHNVLILLDSGATTSAIDRKTVEKFKLPLLPLPSAIRAINADGTDNSAGYITHACSLILNIGSFVH